MRRRSEAGGKSAKAQRRKTAAHKGRIAPKAVQPSAAVAADANEALRLLASSAPDLDEARAASKRIVNDSQHINEVIDNIRLMFNTDRPTKAPLDVNELIREVITLVRGEIENQRVSVRTELANELPRVPANLVQLRQVMMNLVTNAVDAMHAVTDRHRVLRIKTGIYERSHLIITAEDSERGSIRRTSTASSSRSLQRNPTECVWGCRFAGRSSQITAGVWRWPTVSPMDRSFWYFYPEVHRSEDDERVGCFR
jgi:hypothetical protein